jgi:rubrerythrin
VQPTTTGLNRTGAIASEIRTQAMREAVNELTPPLAIDTGAIKAQRMAYVREADAVGSIPPPASWKGMVKTSFKILRGGNPEVLLDKIGERIAFERGGTRLYDALITKYEVVSKMENGRLPPASAVVMTEGDGALVTQLEGESALETLLRIRNEELEHFHLLSDAMVALGGDPTAQTPSADVIATASMGLIQVVTDPRTTLAQCLNAMLTAELTDNAGWELLIELADYAGEDDIAGEFLGALAEEQEHMIIVRSWLGALVAHRAATPAV